MSGLVECLVQLGWLGLRVSSLCVLPANCPWECCFLVVKLADHVSHEIACFYYVYLITLAVVVGWSGDAVENGRDSPDPCSASCFSVAAVKSRRFHINKRMRISLRDVDSGSMCTNKKNTTVFCSLCICYVCTCECTSWRFQRIQIGVIESTADLATMWLCRNEILFIAAANMLR